LVGAFGQLLMSIRAHALDKIQNLTRSADEREQLGRIFREVYEQVSKLDLLPKN